jgi:hypothetical protein
VPDVLRATTWTAQYHPVRMICASPPASFSSDLSIRICSVTGPASEHVISTHTSFARWSPASSLLLSERSPGRKAGLGWQ